MLLFPRLFLVTVNIRLTRLFTAPQLTYSTNNTAATESLNIQVLVMKDSLKNMLLI